MRIKVVPKFQVFESLSAKIDPAFLEHETFKRKKKGKKWQGTNNSDVRLLNRATHSKRAFTRSTRNPRSCKCLSGNRGTSSRQTFPSEARSVLWPCPKNMHVPNEYRSFPLPPLLLPSIRANRRASGRSLKRRDLPGTFLPVTQLSSCLIFLISIPPPFPSRFVLLLLSLHFALNFSAKGRPFHFVRLVTLHHSSLFNFFLVVDFLQLFLFPSFFSFFFSPLEISFVQISQRG